MRGPITEGRSWLDQAVQVYEANPNSLKSALSSDIFSGAGEMARIQGDFERALKLKQQNLELCRQQGNERRVAAILHGMATIYSLMGNCERSLALAEEAVALRRKLGNPLGVSHALSALWFALMCLDRPQEAREAVEEAMLIDRDHQYHEGLVDDLITLMFIAVRESRYEDAQRIFEELVPLSQGTADQVLRATGIYAMATLAAARGQAHQAARLLGIAHHMAARGGFQFEIPGQAWFKHTIQETKSFIGEAVWEQEYRAGYSFAEKNDLTMEQSLAFATETKDD
jgi:tetratricopeptide (TPR) repeat protein